MSFLWNNFSKTLAIAKERGQNIVVSAKLSPAAEKKASTIL